MASILYYDHLIVSFPVFDEQHNVGRNGSGYVVDNLSLRWNEGRPSRPHTSVMLPLLLC